MKVYISNELKSAYILSNNSLMFVNIHKSGVYDEDDFCDIDNELVGDEKVVFMGQVTDMSTVYGFIRNELLMS